MWPSRGSFARVWFHVYLILGDILALRRWGGEGEYDPLIPPDGEELSTGGTPPSVRKVGGCKAMRGCAWWLCRHEAYKIQLAHDKNQSDIKVRKKSGKILRGMSEEQMQRYLENRFLERLDTARDMYGAAKAAFKGETKGCVWANGAMTQFEEWLKHLLPARHACVKNVLDLHPPAEQICLEVFTGEFKKGLRKTCQEDLQPPTEEEGRWANKSKVVLKTFGAVSTVSMGLFVFSTLNAAAMLIAMSAVASVPVLILIAVAIPAIAKEICKFLSRRRLLKRGDALRPPSRHPTD